MNAFSRPGMSRRTLSSTSARGLPSTRVSTPEYAGTLPGSLKNLLDWRVGGGDL
jgi:hypothetical protein